MRLLIYLLAMMTGFSAAEAACPVAATPAAVAQGAVIAATVASVELDLAPALLDKVPGLPTVAEAPAETLIAVVGGSPVIRHDITRQ